MSKYRVEYENDIDDAENPREAAESVRQDIVNGHALGFTVTELLTGKKFSVDLGEMDEEDIVLQINED